MGCKQLLLQARFVPQLGPKSFENLGDGQVGNGAQVVGVVEDSHLEALKELVNSAADRVDDEGHLGVVDLGGGLVDVGDLP